MRAWGDFNGLRQGGTRSSAFSLSTGDTLQELAIFSSWPPHPWWWHRAAILCNKCLFAHYVVSVMARCSSQLQPPSVDSQLGTMVKCNIRLSRKGGCRTDIPSPSSTTTISISPDLFPRLWLHRGRSVTLFVLGVVVEVECRVKPSSPHWYLSVNPAGQLEGTCGFSLQLHFWDKESIFYT